jgi:hypothetical protein
VILVIEATDTNIVYKLYDKDYVLIQSTTHTTNLPTLTSLMYPILFYSDGDGDSSNSLKFYNSKIILKR